MKRLILVSVMAAAAVVWTVPQAAAAEYTSYVGCGLSRETLPSEVCYLGDPVGAFFRVDDADADYEICVRFPSHKQLCAPDQNANQGTLYVNSITTDQLGPHRVDWFVEGDPVATWTFNLEAAPPPVSAPVIPPVVAPSEVTPFSRTALCDKARTRVRTLNAKLRSARRRAAKDRVREKLRLAKANRNIRCR